MASRYIAIRDLVFNLFGADEPNNSGIQI